jgi:ABC-type nitrate/sulfonate/bicarbonate transport system substrate-binding protein
MRLTVADAISPSYFVAIAAIQLGFFKQEGVDVEFVFSPPNPSQALKDGAIDFFGGSPFTGLRTFPAGEVASYSARSPTTPTGSWRFAPTSNANKATSTR